MIADQKKLEKLIKKLRNEAEELENGNYHDACSAFSNLADYIELNVDMGAEELLFKSYEYLIKEVRRW